MNEEEKKARDFSDREADKLRAGLDAAKIVKPDKILNKEKRQQDLQKAMDSIDLPEIESQSGLAVEVKFLHDEANQMTKYMEFWVLPPDYLTEKEDK